MRHIPERAVTDGFTQALARVTAGLTIVVGLAVLAGWIVPLPAVTRILPSYPSPYPNEALGLVGAALGLVGIATGQRALAWIGAIVAAAIGGLTFLQYAAGFDLGVDRWLLRQSVDGAAGGRFPGRMPASSAIALLQVGMGLFALSGRRRTGGLAILAGIVGATAAALGLTVVVGYASGTLVELRYSFVAGMSPEAAIAYLALGISIVAVAWDLEKPVAMPRWLAPAVGIAGFTTSLLVWKALSSRDAERLADQLVQEAGAARHAIRVEIDGLVKDLSRLAARTAQLTPDDWALDAEAQVRDIPAYEAVAWFDSTGRLARAVPAYTSERFLLLQGATGTAPVDTVRPTRYPTRPVSATLIGSGRLLTLRVAVCGVDECSGQVAGVFNLQRIFEAAVDPSRGVCVLVSSGGSILYRKDDECRGGSHLGHSFLSVGPMSWTVTARPTERMLAAAGSTLPTLILLMGMLSSGLLATSLRLAQRSWHLARQLERREVTRALETATDGVWEWELPNGPMRRPAMWRGLGYDGEGPPASRDGWEHLIHPDDRPMVSEAIADHLSGKTDSLTAEYRIRAADGSWHWIVDRARVVERSALDRPLRVFGIYADITERRAAAEKLRASERRFRAIFDSAFQFQALLDLEGRLLEANRTALDFAAVGLESVRGQPFWATPWWRGSADREARLEQACVEAASGRVVHYQDEVSGAGGRTATVEFSVKPIRDDTGRVVQLLAEGRDVTARVRAERALRELDTLSTMGRLAARVAHEVNNPLAGIQNSFMLIKDAIPPAHPYYGYVGAIEREIARIASVTRELYGLYRAEHGAKRESSIAVAIADAVTLLDRVNRAAKVRIVTDTERAPSTLPHPDALIRQIVFNLVQNAVEASPPGGTVHVTAWTGDDACLLSVRDEGPGIPVPLRQRVFSEFYSTKTGLRTGGMGLGLSIVRRSLRAVSGEIEVLDPPEGGAELRVRLPLTRTETEGHDESWTDTAGRRRGHVSALDGRLAAS